MGAPSRLGQHIMIVIGCRNRNQIGIRAKDAADLNSYSGLIRLHVLHRTTKAPIFGLGMIEELARHGY